MAEEEEKPFRVIVAGGRGFNDFAVTVTVLDMVLGKKLRAGEVVQIVSGKASGADTMGERWAHLNKLKVLSFPAPWDDWEGKPLYQVGTRGDGKKYWKGAGHYRNSQMADNAEALVCFWDGRSTGTKNMINTARKKGLLVRVFDYEGNVSAIN